MKKILLLASALALGAVPMSAQIDDDIYYNPKNSDTASKKDKKKAGNYIANFQDMDVDEYNMRGQYYSSPVDTIGAEVASGQDFVYTTQVQKFYNPTIVVDNADLLSDIINDSYGNVNIEFNFNGTPYFGAYYPVYNNWWNLVSLLPASYWGMGCYTPSWAWNPAYSWAWGSYYPYPAWSLGPAWAWGPSLNWNYYWGWGWGPGGNWGRPIPPARPYYADYRPGGNRPVSAGGNWAHIGRPGSNYGGHRYGTSASGRPVSGMVGQRPGTPGGAVGSWGGASSGNGHTGSTGNVGNGHNGSSATVSNGHRQRGEGAFTGTTTGNRLSGNVSTSEGGNRGITNSGTTVTRNQGGHRTTGGGYETGTPSRRTSGSSTTTSTQRRTTSGNSSNSYNRSTSHGSSSGSYTHSTGGSHRSTSGGGFSGGSRGGGSRSGGSRGGHR